MNVFEDLITELKEENLLENTVIDTGRQNKADAGDLDFSDSPEPVHEMPETGSSLSQPADLVQEESYAEVEAEEDSVEAKPGFEIERGEAENTADTAAANKKKPASEKEFYKKRAAGEVSSLQMVEHVLTGVEREYAGAVPKPFEDFSAKKALNAYLQAVESDNPNDLAVAEHALMRETETWCSALAERDRGIAVSSLRQFCENSRPALSSQALLSLARFYRNLPYSELVRAKFDFVATRLFSRPADYETRLPLFTRDEAHSHITTLYKDWSSIPLYAAADDESQVLLAAMSFEDLSSEAENAESLDQLIEGDFFGRLRMFKESISELFYAPNVTAAAIDCNIRIGNAYVKLIDRERANTDAESIQAKYGDLNDSEVSDAAARTLDLVALLRERPQRIESIDVDDGKSGANVHPAAADPKKKAEGTAIWNRLPFVGRFIDSSFSVNKWYIVFAAILISASMGLYVWTDVLAHEDAMTAGVEIIEIDNTFMKDHVKTARISGDTFYALLQPSWDGIPMEKREEFLRRVFQFAQEKGCKQVNLIAKDGKAAGFASSTRVDVVMP